jgi:hypothetical protein
MKFIVKSSSVRWENGSFYEEFSFKEILRMFLNGDRDEEKDYMLENVANLNVNEKYMHEFFMDDVYTFKRIE